MNPRILAVPMLAAAIAIGIYFFVGREKSASAITLPATAVTPATVHPETPHGKNTASGKSLGPAGKKSAVDWTMFAALSGKSGEGAAQIPEPTAEDIARFLAKHGETAVNLVVAFEKTHDRHWLERALELFPNSPVVLMAAVDSIPSVSPRDGETYHFDPKRMEFIERFKAADANNPLPCLFSAQEFFKSGQTADALADVRAALGRPGFYTYSTERMDSAQKLYEGLGLGPVEASALAIFSVTLPHMTAANQTSRGLMEWQKTATESGDTAAADDALRLTYSLGRTFATPEASRMLIGQLVGISMETRALKALPDGSQPDWLKVTPADRLAELDRQKAGVQEVAKGIASVVQSQDGELLAEYLRRVRTESEAAAYEWLKTQKK